MAKFQGGVQAASELLMGLSKEGREKVLAMIRERDPAMALTLIEHLYSLEDLIYLTPIMYSEFLKDIKISDLALALKASSPQLKDFIYKNSPRGIRQEIDDVLTGPLVLMSRVQEAEKRIMDTFRKKIDDGHIVIDRTGKDAL